MAEINNNNVMFVCINIYTYLCLGVPQNGKDFRALKPFLPQTYHVRRCGSVIRKTNDHIISCNIIMIISDVMRFLS